MRIDFENKKRLYYLEAACIRIVIFINRYGIKPYYLGPAFNGRNNGWFVSNGGGGFYFTSKYRSYNTFM